jgi:xanthine dehydrogenase accessory factor
MESTDIEVLRQALQWLAAGRQVTLATVVQTWGSSPRPPGAMLAICEDGRFAGSVSGGCVEYDLVERIRNRTGAPGRPEILLYGVTKEEAQRNRIPCGGTLQILVEPIRDAASLQAVYDAISRRQAVTRMLDMQTGNARVRPAEASDGVRLEGERFEAVYGPRWRLYLIGAGELAHYLALQALMLDYQVFVIDPREDYIASWDVAEVPVLRGMPDDVLKDAGIDDHTAVVAVTHDAVLDDLALWEALKSPAFYVGALGSEVTTAKRRERLAMFDLAATEIQRLRGPVGLYIGSRTPPEIAISILAEMILVRNGIANLQAAARPRKAVPADPFSCSVA